MADEERYQYRYYSDKLGMKPVDCIEWMDGKPEVFMYHNGNSVAEAYDIERLCQCTGVRDIDGDLIFEWDVVSLKAIEHPLDTYGVVKWSNGGYWIQTAMCQKQLCRELIEELLIKVIGNRFDNKPPYLHSQFANHE